MPRVIEPKVNENRNIVPLEDLTIFAELTAIVRGRSILTNEPLSETINFENTQKDTNVTFTFPQAKEGEKPSLTTSWTNIGGQSREKTTEGFGITNIDIQFDASFVPRVTIDFIDIRGAALFEGGRDSKYYGAFFNLPYPLYLLQFKGYYGDAVTYPLHLMKFNSRFNGETGNFEIKCEFIGHTFAFLSDMLMGYSLAAPYMSKYDNKSASCPCTINGEIDTIKDYLSKVKKVTKDIDQIRKSNTFTSYTNLVEYKNDIKGIGNVLSEIQKSWQGGNKLDINTFIREKFIKVDKGTTYNDFLDDLIFNYDGAEFNYINEKVEKLKVKETKKNYFTVVQNNTNKTIITEVGGQKDINFNLFVSTLEELENVRSTQAKRFSNELEEQSKKVIEENAFNPTIKYAFDVISCGFEIFLNDLRDVSNRAETRYTDTNDSITKVLKSAAIDTTKDRKNKNKIYPWPLWYESKTNFSPYDKSKKTKQTTEKVLKYPGSDFRLRDMEEVKFVEEFASALLRVKSDLSATERLITSGDGWAPSSIIESTVWDETITNPYDTLNQQEVLKRLMSRALVNISYSYGLGYSADNTDDLKYRPDVLGIGISDESDFFNFTELNAYWKRITKDVGYLEKLAEAEASNLFVSNPSDKIIKNILKLDGEGLLTLIEDKASELYDNNGLLINLYKKEGGFKIPGIAETGDTQPNVYYCAANENTDTTYDYVGNANVRLQINDDKFVDANSSGADYSNFRIISQSQYDDNIKPKNNKYLDETFAGAYGSNIMAPNRFSEVELSPYNTLLFRNLVTGLFADDKSPYIYTNMKNDNRIPQGFDEGAFFLNSKSEYVNDFINVCLESSDYRDDIFSSDEPNKFFEGKNDKEEVYYGDFPFYIGTYYVGQIQDTYFYKLNKQAQSTTNFSGVSYPNSKLNTAYLWLNSLELYSFGNQTEGPLFSFCNSSGIIELPKIWIVYIGAFLWRQSQTNDPILYGDITKLNGIDNKSQITSQTDKIALGAHWDYLNNTSFYGDKIPQYLSDGIIIEPQIDELLNIIFKFSLKTNFQTYSYQNVKKSVFHNTFISSPQIIRNTFISEFIDFATTEGSSTNVMDLSWKSIQNEIENNDIRRHYSYIENEYALPRKSRVLQEYSFNGKLTLNSTKSSIEYLENNEVIQYPNVGLFTDDKALFFDGYYTFTPSGKNNENDQYLTTSSFSQSGYVNTSSLESSGIVEVYSPKNRFLSQTLIEILNVKNDNIYILNGTWRSFIPRLNDIEVRTGTDIGNSVANDRFNTFYATENTLVRYLQAFIDRLEKIHNEDEEKKKDQESPENVLNDDDLKLALYLQFKNLYDKWIATELLANEDNYICVSKYFSYVDRAMRDIGDVAVLNPKSITQLLDNSQTSFYNVAYEILSQNNFDFFPLPHFNGFGAEDKKGYNKVARMFENVLTVEETVFKPNFVCIFVGERANTVDLNGSEYGNNVIDFDDPSMTSDEYEENLVNVFRVSFGLENQNIFNSISLDQSDYKETSESLQVIDDLVKSKNEVNNVSYKGNDLYQVYSKRSYNCNVEMLGCAVVEPLMYFQLSYVPIFKGAYMIHQVSHNITPNHMTTSFTGVRIPFTNIQPISSVAVALGLTDDDDSRVTDRDETILDEEGNTVREGDTTTQGGDNDVNGKWRLVPFELNESGEVEIVNRT
tara:strand:+ start:492 stop:5513 length:5022 start_codon:yes stop_codon:yes gene_type:complete